MVKKRKLSTAFDSEVSQNNNNKEQAIAKESSGDSINYQTIRDVGEILQAKYKKKAKKPTVEETHVRTTFLFDRELSKRLDRMAKGKRGFKTMFYNEAIKALLDEMEEDR